MKILAPILLLTFLATASSAGARKATRQIPFPMKEVSTVFFHSLPSVELSDRPDVKFKDSQECPISLEDKKKLLGLFQFIDEFKLGENLPPFIVEASCGTSQFAFETNTLHLGSLLGPVAENAGTVIHEYVHMIVHHALRSQFPDIEKYSPAEAKYHALNLLLKAKNANLLDEDLKKELDAGADPKTLLQKYFNEVKRLDPLMSVFLAYNEYLADAIAVVLLGRSDAVSPDPNRIQHVLRKGLASYSRDFAAPFIYMKWLRLMGELPDVSHHILEPSWNSTWLAVQPHLVSFEEKKRAAHALYRVVFQQMRHYMADPQKFYSSPGEHQNYDRINREHLALLLEAFKNLTPPIY